MPDSPNGFEDHGYRVTWELTLWQLRQVHALRADVFCRELGWVGAPEDEAEQDEFDARSVHVGVIDSCSNVIGALRLTRCDATWMLDTVFSELVPPGRVVKAANAVEASRLLVCRQWRERRHGNGIRTCDLVYKGAYAYCVLNAIRYVYMVTSDVVLRHLLRTGLPCEPLASPVRMPDGVNAVAVRLDWNRLSRQSEIATWYDCGWGGWAPAGVDASAGDWSARHRHRMTRPPPERPVHSARRG